MSARRFIVVGSERGLVHRVLLALHTAYDADCLAVCARGTRFIRLSRLLSDYREADFNGKDDEVLVDWMNGLAHSTPDMVLVPCDCDGYRIASRIRNRLNFRTAPTPDASTLGCFENKWKFYRFCKENRLNTPETRFFETKHDLDFASTAHALSTPFVVKPILEGGSKGVCLISSGEDYQNQIVRNNDYQYAPLIAQTCIRGTDIGIDLLAVKGKLAAFAVQQREYPQHPAAKIHFSGSAELEQLAQSILSFSGYEGVMNIDARIEDGTGKVFLIESNPRYWTSLLASVWCGLNFAAESVEAAAMPPHSVKKLSAGTADMYYHPMFCPTLWQPAAFDRGERGRLLRLMLFNAYVFSRSTKDVFMGTGTRPPPTVDAARFSSRSTR